MRTPLLHRPLWLLAGLAVLGLLLVLAPTSVRASADGVDNSLLGGTGQRYKIVAGPIRNTGHGWSTIVDGTHRPTGIKSVSSSRSEITVRFDFKAYRIVSFVVTPDETLAKAGLFSGASVDRDLARITIASPKGVVDPSTVTTKKYPWSNLWVYGVFEVAP